MLISEIFKSIQGESSYSGLPCSFIRTCGCNLKCSYCDTTYAYEIKEERSISRIIEEIKNLKVPLVEITGGEPLIQKDTPFLAETLIKEGFKVLVETNGSLNIDLLPENVIRIVDLKCPGSGMSDQTDWHNIERLREKDEIKFVIGDRKDYLWSLEKIREYNLSRRAEVLFSPVFGKLESEKLVNWILKDNLTVRFQLQIHKYIWPPDMRGV